jgi:uncharacterized integral membrane protein (TIGR00698 family)
MPFVDLGNRGFGMSVRQQITQIIPGVALSAAISMLALGLERLEIAVFGASWVDGLVFAILAGTLLHTVWGLPAVMVRGVHFSVKFLLELAIVLLGASISFETIAETGVVMVGIVAAVVLTSLAISYGIGRALGLSERLATLVACGNSICGNSAIVATAPVIGATADDIAASIGFTAALGIVVVLSLPLAFTLFGVTEWQYGVVAGMTVYAVPQVLAATMPVGMLSTQIGAIVKLMRVLMLGPVIVLIGLRHSRKAGVRVSFTQMVPWFILGFLMMMAATSLGLLPEAVIAPIKTASTLLTVLSMAALGLSVNLRTVLASGGRVLATGALSVLALGILSAITLVFLPAQ